MYTIRWLPVRWDKHCVVRLRRRRRRNCDGSGGGGRGGGGGGGESEDGRCGHSAVWRQRARAKVERENYSRIRWQYVTDNHRDYDYTRTTQYYNRRDPSTGRWPRHLRGVRPARVFGYVRVRVPTVRTCTVNYKAHEWYSAAVVAVNTVSVFWRLPINMARVTPAGGGGGLRAYFVNKKTHVAECRGTNARQRSPPLPFKTPPYAKRGGD